MMRLIKESMHKLKLEVPNIVADCKCLLVQLPTPLGLHVRFTLLVEACAWALDS
jgi:hypothetical protein